MTTDVSFYETFERFQKDFAQSVKLQEKALELQETQNEILIGIYTRLAPTAKEPTPAEPQESLTGVPQIDAVLAKQKAKLTDDLHRRGLSD